MRISHDIVYSVRSLAAAKSRTLLTALGIIIGVMSVLVVASVGASAEELVIGQVKSLGSNLIGILPGGSQQSGPPPVALGIVTTTLTRDDAEAVAGLAGVAAVTPYVRTVQTVQYRENGIVTTVNGVGERLPLVEDIKISAGRFFSEQDVSGFTRVALLGADVARSLVPDDNPIGRMIRIKGFSFQIIGTIAPRGSAFFQNQDDQVMIPVSTAQKLIAGIDYVNFLRVKVDTEDNIPRVRSDAAALLRRRHNIADPSKDDFTIRSTDQAISVLSDVTGVLRAFLLAVTAVSLIVGGINIMNVMLVAVRERTAEIGLRKALGAPSGRILSQFLFESAFVAGLGGLIGIILGIAVSFSGAAIITRLGYGWRFILPIDALFASFCVAVAVGVIFGVYPALKAARLEAIAALRYE